jgi:hypothetical protein
MTTTIDSTCRGTCGRRLIGRRSGATTNVVARIQARNMCARCYHRAVKSETIDEYPRVYRRLNDVVNDYVVLRAHVGTLVDLADRIGMSACALEQALTRARRKGLLSNDHS